MNRQQAIFIVLVLLQAAFVFADAPKIDFLKTQFVYPSNIQISWKLTDDDGLTRLELFDGSKLIYKEDITGTVHSSLYQIPEDNKTHTFKLLVYDITNISTAAVKVRGDDKIPPEIITSLKTTSNTKNLYFETNEPTYCKAGIEQAYLVELADDYVTVHNTSFPFKEGSNKIFILCSDEQENVMSKAMIFDFTYDITIPGKVTNISYSTKDGKAVISWSSASDSSGIGHYNIYNSLKLLASTKTREYTTTTNESIYFISAVDNAGNEGEKSEYNPGRDFLLSSSYEAENKTTATKPATKTEVKETAKKPLSTTTIVAWSSLGILIICFSIWKFHEHRKDRHGLRKYLHKRRKMRDFDTDLKI